MAFAALPPRRQDAELADPEPAIGGWARDWGVCRSGRIAFPDPVNEVRDAEYAARLDLYVRDMLREHALDAATGPDERDRAGWSYSEMATELIERCVPAQEPVDLLVLAYATPDINPGRNMAALLSERCPGAPLAFGLTDQGVATPFTGLRLIREYARTAGLRRSLLLVVEQAALPYQADRRATTPLGHTGVALLLGDTAHPATSAPPIRLGPMFTRAGVRADAIEQEISALSPDPANTTVILGSALVGAANRLTAAGLGQMRVAQPGRALTGLWWELADELDTPGGPPRRLVLCDYDPLQRCICVAALGSSGAWDQSHGLETTLKGSPPASAIAAR